MIKEDAPSVHVPLLCEGPGILIDCWCTSSLELPEGETKCAMYFKKEEESTAPVAIRHQHDHRRVDAGPLFRATRRALAHGPQSKGRRAAAASRAVGDRGTPGGHPPGQMQHRRIVVHTQHPGDIAQYPPLGPVARRQCRGMSVRDHRTDERLISGLAKGMPHFGIFGGGGGGGNCSKVVH